MDSNNLIFSLFFYILLFVGICFSLVLIFVLLNIFFKSYKPQNALLVILPILFLFLISSFFALTNVINVTQYLKDLEQKSLR